MPHNLYLHSALVQTRRIGRTVAEKREACRFNFVRFVSGAERRADRQRGDSGAGRGGVFQATASWWTEIEQAQSMLSPLLGTALASGLFADRAAGQRAILHADRNLRGPDRDGRISRSAHAAVAAAADRRARWRSFPPFSRCIMCGRARHLRSVDSEPGDPQHAASLRGDSADPLHQRPADGWASLPIGPG